MSSSGDAHEKREDDGVEAAPGSGRPAFTYMVECSDGTLYTGWARDVEARVRAHNRGRGARYTRSRRPVRLRYWEQHPDRASAMRHEKALKRLPRKRKLALIARFAARPVARSDGEETP